MSSHAGADSAEHEVPNPLVVECDLAGCGLQMSDHARASLGNPEDLRALVRALTLRVRRLRFTGLLESSGRVWISSEPDKPGELKPQAAAGLSQLQTNLVRHYFRLEAIERRLALKARTRRVPPGAAAIRQIEMERGRLARELHTGVGQTLAAIRLQLNTVEGGLQDAPQLVKQSLSRISTLSRDALEQVRAISRRLHPPEWQRLPLETAIEQLWNLSGIPQRYESTLEAGPLKEQPSMELKSLAYRAAQEAFSNLARHSNATRVEVWLGAREGQLVLRIRDNGVGFDAASLFSAPASIESGIGLRSIREQSEALGGHLAVESGPKGTTLELSAPFSTGA